MPARINILFRTFGKLTVLSEAPPHRFSPRTIARMSNCRCECGKEIVVSNNHLRQGHTTSCGCAHVAMLVERLTKHGHAKRAHNGGKTRTYHCWRNMIRRCTIPSHSHYKHYGGRGITVCERWLASFENFLADVGECPAGMTLGRIDNNKGYFAENVRFESNLAQAQNTRRTIVGTVRGVTGSLSLLCRHFKISQYSTIRRRVQEYGWEIERALFTPLNATERIARQAKHGGARRNGMTKSYKAWRAMLRRCRDPKIANYANYGGRGITVCNEWLEFGNFLQDMGECPPNGELRRKNTDGNYEPSNCFYLVREHKNTIQEVAGSSPPPAT